MKKYYDILGLESNASSEDIKKAYRKLSKKYHPDVNKDESASVKMAEINDAYEKLTNPSKSQSHSQNFNGGNFDFEFSFYNFGNNEKLHIIINISLTFEQIYIGNTYKSTYVRNINNKPHTKDFDVEIYGARESTTLSQPNEGHVEIVEAGNNHFQMSGDLIVKIKVETLSNTKKMYDGEVHSIKDYSLTFGGGDIYLNLYAHYSDVIDGFEFSFKHFDNKTYKVTIPKESNTDKMFKLAEKGFIETKRFGTIRGHLYIVLKTMIDYNRLNNDK